MAHILTAADYRSGEALARASYGMSMSARMLMDQRDAIGDDLQRTEPRLPLTMDARVGASFVKGFTGSKHQKLRREMTFGGQAVFDAQGSGASLVAGASAVEYSRPSAPGRKSRRWAGAGCSLRAENCTATSPANGGEVRVCLK